MHLDHLKNRYQLTQDIKCLKREVPSSAKHLSDSSWKSYSRFQDIVNRLKIELRIFWRRNLSVSTGEMELVLTTVGGVVGLFDSEDCPVGSGDTIDGGILSKASTATKFSAEESSLSSTMEVEEHKDSESSSSS
jgi:hypothetical protein